jgi:hypothetical protein
MVLAKLGISTAVLYHIQCSITGGKLTYFAIMGIWPGYGVILLVPTSYSIRGIIHIVVDPDPVDP